MYSSAWKDTVSSYSLSSCFLLSTFLLPTDFLKVFSTHCQMDALGIPGLLSGNPSNRQAFQCDFFSDVLLNLIHVLADKKFTFQHVKRSILSIQRSLGSAACLNRQILGMKTLKIYGVIFRLFHLSL